MRNAKSLAGVHTHTNSLSAIKVALFSVANSIYSKLEANGLT